MKNYCFQDVFDGPKLEIFVFNEETLIDRKYKDYSLPNRTRTMLTLMACPALRTPALWLW